MKVTKQALAKLDTVYKGYLEGAKVDALLRDFGIKFAAGHWCAGPFADRFAPGGYTEPDELDGSIFAQIKRVAAAGIKGIEFHENVFTDAKFRKVPRMVKKVREATKRTGLTPTNMNMNLWGVPFWKLGSVCNPDPRVRKAALGVALQAVEKAGLGQLVGLA